MRGLGRATLVGAFRFAGRGVLEAALSQRNMRVHLVAAVLVGVFASAVPLSQAEKLALLACIFLVLAAEVLNTAIEAVVDLATGETNERARVAKDAAAGAVLVLSVGAVAVFAVVLVGEWDAIWATRREVGRALAPGLLLAALSAFLVLPFPRTARLDVPAALVGVALLVPLTSLSRSLVFTGVAGLAFAVCAAAAFARRARG